MGFLKKLFGLEKENKISPDFIGDKEDEMKIGTICPETTSEIMCEHCHLPIWGNQKIKTFQNKKYHVKPCWRDLQKIAKKELFK